MAVRRFLWVIAILTMLFIAGAVIWRLFETDIMRMAVTPSMPFTEAPTSPAPDYGKADAWAAAGPAAPGASVWTPEGYHAPPHPAAAIFYVAPSTYIKRDRWNAPYDDKESGDRTDRFVESQASALNGVGAIWAPRYRQAVFGAFFSDRAKDKAQALALAEGDVLRAFDVFLKAQHEKRPIILAAHSQGSLHLISLLRHRVAGTPLAKRIAAAYVVGWPISVKADLPALGLPACAAPGQSGCILSWQSFAEPAAPSWLTTAMDTSNGYTGQSRHGSQMLCTNPLTGGAAAKASASANLGALMPNGEGGSAKKLVPAKVGAACVGRGILSIGAEPDGYGKYVLPGNNYHVYDYALFWANIRADAENRLNGWLTHEMAAQ